ncbi:tRNA-(ms[2]io[6]A)-hydroxylase [Pseudomaricurvus alkylphenolicus]|jgi:tRNA-(ms[2]io[6]A)-hydroxylase|uniref:tRNA-(ms[2]io[6]A)-hydroxylase n=1 Tax=Pseudomaricurvus alkylphenolicus TaxID=1306991 RepID=UPI00141DDDA3|nr:tRNA-(ms[2]io[6]A)-hydroxylase [Pseudomaricurvus alkylphenolicus]NIB44943.1 tRNA-(ms[2]io[6]A)-hydroxylase [Pseudomaricurvus alkylphenolicus]
MVDISPILSFLKCRTPDAWVQAALENLETVLLDHAANEMKAAQSAMTLMSKNPTKIDLLNKMSRLAREELVHFEQVLKILKKRGIEYRAIRASSYASSMARHIRKEQRQNFVDTLIVGAIIEARSCERFEALAPHLDEELNKFYLSLLKSEARHFQDYLHLADKYAQESIDTRVEFFLALEQDAILSPDPLFRFHSGLPVRNEYSSAVAGA